MRKLELLAPVGDISSFNAAIENGADALYLGGKSFSARAFTTNFEKEEIADLIKKAHVKGVKVYIVVNTLIFENELNEVIEFLDYLYLNDADAFIVQDLGLIHLIKQRYPKIRLHVSTQQNVHSIEQIKFFEELGVDRIVLAREVTTNQIKEFSKQTKVELEVFAHGALCVSYSGNCLHSSVIGKRSGNRGKCAQPCRMEYALLENNKPISSKKYLLSMKDLSTLEYLDKVIDSGVTSLKIEGRMKSADYVALTVRTYKDAINNYQENKKLTFDKNAISKFNLLFNREFTKGHINKENNNKFSTTLRPNHIGKKIGKVIFASSDLIKIKLDEDVMQKDKIVILQKDDVSFFLSKMKVKNKLVNKAYKNEVIELEVHSFIANGASVYKCLDANMLADISKTYEANMKKIPIRMKFFATLGSPLTLIVKDYNNHSVCVKSDYIVEMAINSPANEEKIKEQLNKLGSSNYKLVNSAIEIDDNVMIPNKFINELRRDAIEQLHKKRENVYNRTSDDIVNEYVYSQVDKKHSTNLKLSVRVKNLHQLEAIKDLNVDVVYYDDVNTFNLAKNRYSTLNIIPSYSRINSDKTCFNLSNSLIGNLGDISRLANYKKISDVYLNVTNSYAINALLKSGVDRIGLSLELSKNNIELMLKNARFNHKKIPSTEVLVYGRVQNMITKYCFIANELGYERKQCGACKTNRYCLVDRMNYKFPVLTDNDCNVTIYNSKAIHLIDELDNLYNMGVEYVRLDFSVEDPQTVKEITQMYINRLNNQIVETKLFDVTYGHYYNDDL